MSVFQTSTLMMMMLERMLPSFKANCTYDFFAEYVAYVESTRDTSCEPNTCTIDTNGDMLTNYREWKINDKTLMYQGMCTFIRISMTQIMISWVTVKV